MGYGNINDIFYCQNYDVVEGLIFTISMEQALWDERIGMIILGYRVNPQDKDYNYMYDGELVKVGTRVEDNRRNYMKLYRSIGDHTTEIVMCKYRFYIYIRKKRDLKKGIEDSYYGCNRLPVKIMKPYARPQNLR